MKRLGWILLLVGLIGCAAPGPAPRPSDFPLHADGPVGMAVHWRLDEEGATVLATGVVEGADANWVREVVVELQGLDAEGRVVSRGFDYAGPRSFSGRDPWPFSIRVHRQGRETRFVPRVTEVARRERPAGR